MSSNPVSRLGTNQRLAIAALLLGLVAVFSSPTRRASVDPHELALAVRKGFDRVQPREVADWIVKGRADYRLIDLRDADAFAAYHVPTSENIGIDALADSLGHNEKIVLCSEDGTRAGEAWVLLKAQRFNAVYLLDRGVEGWKQDVLFPVIKENPTDSERLENDRRKQVASYFGGAARASGGATAVAGMPDVVPASTPKVQVPSVSGAPRQAAPKKKKEGC